MCGKESGSCTSVAGNNISRVLIFITPDVLPYNGAQLMTWHNENMNRAPEALVSSSMEAINNNNITLQPSLLNSDLPREIASSDDFYFLLDLERLQQEIEDANSNIISGDSNSNQTHANMANGSSLVELVDDQDIVDQPIINEDIRTNPDYLDHQLTVAQQQQQQQPILNGYAINEHNIGRQANQPVSERANILPPARPFKNYFVQLPNGELAPLHPTLQQPNNSNTLKRKRIADAFDCTTNTKKQRTSYVTNNIYIVDSMRSSSESSESDSTDDSSDELDPISIDFGSEFDHEDEYSYSDYEDDYY